MAQKTILTTIDFNEFKDFIKESLLETLNGLNLLKAENVKPNNEVLTRKQTADFLGISLPTLHQLTIGGHLKSFRIGRSVRYYSADVYASLVPVKKGGAKW